jgi:predicted TIM-barrel fold metal-dependent hydrolase
MKLAFVGIFALSSILTPADPSPKPLAEIAPIDAHCHVYKQDAALTALLNELNFSMLDVLVVDKEDKFFKSLEPQHADALKVIHDNPSRIALCTTFSPYDFDSPEFSQRVIRELDADFAQGAVAVKIYKTIGMQIKTKSGKYLMPDDPVFDPIYEEIAARGHTVVAHLAEPTSCWQAPNPDSPDFSYYKEHPEEYAYLHSGWPSKAEILTARDHMLEKHPKLRVVGAHLGSMEVDVDEIAKRFDLYPNFSVDTAARIPYLMLQPRKKVREFLIKYQDRVLYGTDFGLYPESSDSAGLIRDLKRTYLQDWKYFASNEVIKYNGRDIQGLKLPPSVLRKLYHDNALHWFPGLPKVRE